MSSSSPEPVSVKVKRQKTKTKSKGKGKAREISPRNEGEDPHWDYEPLPGFSPLENVVDTEEFEWDAMNNDDDCELWLIRVPEGVKPKHLDSLAWEDIASSSSSETKQVGKINRKTTSFDVWNVGEDNDVAGVSGEEIKSLACILPHSKEAGEFRLAPKPITRHLVVAAQTVVATPPKTSPARLRQNPPRSSYPKDLLTHKFQPIGALVGAQLDQKPISTSKPAEDQMDVDEPEPTSKSHKDKSKKEKKAKKEKVKTQAKLEEEAEATPTKGHKRKGDEAAVASSPSKKLKKIKI